MVISHCLPSCRDDKPYSLIILYIQLLRTEHIIMHQRTTKAVFKPKTILKWNQNLNNYILYATSQLLHVRCMFQHEQLVYQL
jgi:hypothetical protein